MWFIGTINNDDSTFAISDKVYDRAMVINLDKRAKVFDAPKVEKMKISSSYLQQLFKEAQEEYQMSSRNLRRIKKLDEFMISHFHLTFGNRIMKPHAAAPHAPARASARCPAPLPSCRRSRRRQQ